jgi:diacylglycerol kinase family enzyme
VSQVLAIRITRFAGLLAKLAPGASLANPDFQLVLFKTRDRLPFLRYMMSVWTNRRYSGPDIEVLPTTECRCYPLETGNRKLETGNWKPETRVFAEADGELLGTLPVAITMSNETVNLLMPRAAAEKSAIL